VHEDRKPRLLVVDDEPDVCTTLASYFGAIGYVVETAASIPEALDKLPEPYDVLLSDIRFPDGNGIDLLAEARRMHPNIPVFLMTGFPTLETVLEAKRQGAIAYFPKPLELATMEARLRSMLGDHKLVEGPILVVGSALWEKMREKLERFNAVCCPEDDAALREMVSTQQPAAALIDATSPDAAALAGACRAAAVEEYALIMVSAEDDVEAIRRILFDAEGIDDVIPANASREDTERTLQTAVERCEALKTARRQKCEEWCNKCEYARPYRNGYYCLQEEECPYGHHSAIWISIQGREHRRCPRRPLLFDSLGQIGFASWSGQVDASRTPEMRKELMGLIRQGYRDIVIDGQGLTGAHYNLIEILGDLQMEFRKAMPNGQIHLINLSDTVLEEFRKTPVMNVKYSGPRMVDEKSTFARWGTVFD
jgi:DNA-binding response OmpR family regulator